MSNKQKYINGNDDIEAAFRWMKKGTPDVKGLAKYLPHTAQDLVDGEVTPEQVAEGLGEIYISLNVASKGMFIDDSEMKLLAMLAGGCALPKKMFRNGQSKAKIDDAETSFGDAIDRALTEHMKQLDPENGAIVPVLLKESIDEVCEAQADDLDRKLFRGKRGVFLKKCPIYGVPLDRYFNRYMPLYQYRDIAEGVGFVVRNSEVHKARVSFYLKATEELAQGTHGNKKRCWNCERFCPDGLRKCSKCCVAGYCTRDCQVLAWKGGHKHKCEDLKVLNGKYQVSSLYKGEFECSPGTAVLLEKHGVTTYFHDYSFWTFATTPWDKVIMDGRSLRDVLGFPSAKAYYENLLRLVEGSWWFFEDANVDVYREVERSGGLDEPEYFLALSRYMCFDYAGLENENRDAIAQYCMSEITVGCKQRYGTSMPASRYVQMYKSRPSVGNTTVRDRWVRDQRYVMAGKFRKEFHK